MKKPLLEFTQDTCPTYSGTGHILSNTMKITIHKFSKWVREITPKDRVAVIYHPDADGFTSAFIASMSIERLRGKNPEMVFCQDRGHVELTLGTVAKLKRRKINKVITVDLCVDQKPENIKKIEEFARVLVIDHHKVYKDLNSKKTLFIKAGEFSGIDPSRYPASKLTFDLFSETIDANDLSWAAAIGIMGDKAEPAWKGFVENSAKKIGMTREEISRIKKSIDGVEALKPKNFGRLMRCFRKRNNNPRGILTCKCGAYAGKLDKILWRIVDKAEKKAEIHSKEELMLYKFKSKYNIKSAVINELCRRHPHTTIVLIENNGKKGMLGISARRSDYTVKVNELLEEATRNLEKASGGGHIPAAGGRLMKKDYKKFRKKLLEILAKKK